MIISIDTETYEFDKKEGVYKPTLNTQKFVLGCARIEGRKKHKFFYSAEEMFNWMIDKINMNSRNRKRTYFYAHNANYDWLAIAKNKVITDNSEKNPISISYIKTSPLLVNISNKGFIVDTMQFYRMSLNAVGYLLNLKKGKLPEEVKEVDELKEYIMRDVNIVLKAVVNLKNQMKKIGYTPRKIMTSGQLAMSSWMTYNKRKGNLNKFCSYNEKLKRYEIPRSGKEKLIRNSYRGARNECYKLGKYKDCTLVDMNAMYSYIMSNMQFPDLKKERYYCNKYTQLIIEKYCHKRIGIAECTMSVPNLEIGILPVSYSGYQVYPTKGTINGTWTFSELSLAIKNGYKIIDSKYCILWENNEYNPFKEYLQELWDIEKKHLSYMHRLPIKLLRNNLYGKFAQKSHQKSYVIDWREKVNDYLYKGYDIESSLGDKYIYSIKAKAYRPSYVNPIISSEISAQGRILLYKSLIKIPAEDRLYCDTDGIVYKGNHRDKFNISIERGDWKIEAQGDAKFLGEKRYYIGNKVKLSGVPTKQRSRSSIDNEISIPVKKMVGLNKAIRHKQFNELGTFYDEHTQVEKHSKAMLLLPEHINEVQFYEN